MDASQIQRDFDPVTVDDYPLIQRYLSLAQYEESNHNLVNMILWIDSYPLFKCQNENWLLLLGVRSGLRIRFPTLVWRKTATARIMFTCVKS